MRPWACVLALAAGVAGAAAAGYCVPSAPADVLFVLSSDADLTRAQFEAKKQIIEQFVQQVNIGPNDIRVGVVEEFSYADLEFHMDDHMDKHELLTALRFIYFGQGGAVPGTALSYIDREGMDNHLGGRAGVPNVIIYLTTANPPSTDYAVNSSAPLKAAGTWVVGLGAGGFLKEDLIPVASGCHYVYQVDELSRSDLLVAAALNLTCDAIDAVDCCDCCELPTCCPLDLDIQFLIDASSNQSREDFDKQRQWASGLLDALRLDHGLGTRVGAVTYAEHVHPQWDMDAYRNLTILKQAFDFLPFQYGARDYQDSFEWLNQHGFPNPPRDGAQKVVFVTSTGPSSHPSLSIQASQALQAQNVTVVGVGVGPLADMAALQSVCTPGYVVNYPTFDAMKADPSQALVLGCGGGPNTTPGPKSLCEQKACAQGSTCKEEDDEVLGRIAKCHCQPGYSGERCETGPSPSVYPGPATTVPTTNVPSTTTTTTPAPPTTPTTTTTTTPAAPTTNGVVPGTGVLCVPNPCLNGGTCVDVAGGSFDCVCTADYGGAFCLQNLAG